MRRRIPAPAASLRPLTPPRARARTRPQCELIAAKYGVVHISTGELLRAEVDGGSPYGSVAGEFM